MSLARYQPNYLLKTMQNDLANFFDNTWGNAFTDFPTTGWRPSVDIKETEGNFVVHVDAPGVAANEVKVSFNNGVLAIEGKRELNREEDKAGYHCIERSAGSFCRKFSLPTTIDAAKIKATSKNGVVEITIPKQTNNTTKYIQVEETK